MMKRRIQTAIVAFLIALGSCLATLPVEASTYYGHSYYRQAHPIKSYFYRHPYQEKAAIGAGIGAAAGGILGGGVAKGAVLGAGAGTGYEFLKRKGIF